MRKPLIFMLLFLGTGLYGRAQDYDPEQYIAWNEYYALSWDNFNGKADPGTFGDAGTAVKIMAKPYLVKKRIYYNVYALFDRKKSWVSDKSPRLLTHEQLHFDIAELYARLARKKVAELTARGEKDVKTYNHEIQKILRESNRVDRQYDIETLHGGLVEKQKDWETKIARQLKSLEKYKRKKQIVGEK